MAALQSLWPLIGYPALKPHDLRHGVAMEVYEEHHDLEPVRELLGHARIDTTQIYARIRPRGVLHAAVEARSVVLRGMHDEDVERVSM